MYLRTCVYENLERAGFTSFDYKKKTKKTHENRGTEAETVYFEPIYFLTPKFHLKFELLV